jgi:hypothetical protein
MHEEIIGKSGFGKSTYLEHQILGTEGGWVFIDPHGKSAERIADTYPDRALIYWDVSDTHWKHVKFNPLKDIPKGQHPLVAAQVLYAFKAIFGEESWGPRLNNILYNTIRLILDNSGSLNDITRILTDKVYRSRLLLNVSYKPFWDRFERWDDKYRNEAIEPVLNKVSQLDANPIVHSILSDNTIDLKHILDKGMHLVVNLAKGKVGEEPAHLLGALLLSALYSAAQTREFDPPPVRIFADEFQNFVTQSFADILSEARKSGLFLTLSHQYLAQMPKDILPAVFANVGRITAFNVSAEDAAYLSPEMDLAPIQLSDLPPYVAWRKTGIQSFRIETLPPAEPIGRLDAARTNTRARYT